MPERRILPRVSGDDEHALPELSDGDDPDDSPLLRAARGLRKLIPGDPDLGEADGIDDNRASSAIARSVADSRQSDKKGAGIARELGLGALQVWQAMSESQGRAGGEVEAAILFTDLVDFSKWALDAGDEASVRLLRHVAEVTDLEIKSRRGRIVKRLGDGLMAVFGDPEDAVDAGLACVNGVGDLEVDGYRPSLRAGIHAGRPRKLGSDYLGVDVNVAARVTEGAKGGQLLVSGSVAERLPSEDYELKRVRRFRAKGAPKDLEVFSVIAGPQP
jgi:adenylate cyclase